MRGVALLGLRSHPAIFVAWTTRGQVLRDLCNLSFPQRDFALSSNGNWSGKGLSRKAVGKASVSPSSQNELEFCQRRSPESGLTAPEETAQEVETTAVGKL